MLHSSENVSITKNTPDVVDENGKKLPQTSEEFYADVNIRQNTAADTEQIDGIFTSVNDVYTLRSDSDLNVREGDIITRPDNSKLKILKITRKNWNSLFIFKAICEAI